MKNKIKPEKSAQKIGGVFLAILIAALIFRALYYGVADLLRSMGF